MTGVRIVALGLRFLAIWCVVLAAQSVGVVFAVLGQDQSIASRWWGAVPLTIFLVAGALLWKFAPAISRKLYAPGSPDEQFAISAESALRVGCCLLGLSILPRVVYPLFTLTEALLQWAQPGDRTTALFYVNEVLEAGLYLALAWVLTFKSRTIAQFLLARV